MLHKIVETKREEVKQLKASTTIAALLEQAKQQSPARGFSHSLLTSPRPVSVIAEIKKASPSKGLIREPFSPLEIARSYVNAEVEAISVLTDEVYFQGSLEYLRQVREAVPVPVLRKDFVIDEWQLAEARAHGADCVLLIVAILDNQQLHHLSQVARELGMDTLVEVHNQQELEQALTHSQPSLLGINNRNLRTFETSLETTRELIGQVPAGMPVVSESGISSPADISYLHSLGARSVLVGEHFMRQADITQAVRDLVGRRQDSSAK